MATLELHAICEVFPPMAAAELGALAEDIRANGQREPIWVHEGAVIDGRNRLAACEIAGIEPIAREWDGRGSLVGFVLGCNLHRRHLTAGQKADIAAAIKPDIEAEIKAKEAARKRKDDPDDLGILSQVLPPPDAGRNDLGKNAQVLPPPGAGRKAREEAAAVVGVSARYVSDAERIRERSPETADAVKRGEKTIPQAKRELGLAAPPRPTGAAGGPPGMSRVNGREVADPPDVARARAAGRLAADVVPDVDEPADPTAVADVAESIAEGEAMADEALSDDDWLATLPLAGRLAGAPLRIFRADALTYRRLEPARRSYKHHAARAFRAAGEKRGAFIARARSFLGIDHPSRWVECPAPDRGGCGGSGHIPLLGDCPACRGRGYRINA